ncbi:putative protein DUF4202 [Leeuwenhoekiella aestuarii]|uniref:DUF4202 domain-containing protein n=1 Tax=Leeuwenhoekiella aestuarii TaxID=2249426 RepID=A0A4Q0NUJ2_9FLAO|nr:DUF4202 domain-containing protein [Leeuwenhoekiella aestuarii]RXG14281.1 putative protein DUF4202 [Leeuwenhoekiella aestuarii]RXG19030.1 putative protein DUF4202 [Leeuwenhoekiella aestuarii]
MPVQEALEAIDSHNAKDPNFETIDGQQIPKELLYSQRMTAQLLSFEPDASEALQIAARAQHICRWKSPRDAYPQDRVGYLRWREDLKKMHAKLTGRILEELGYSKEFTDRVKFLILKKHIKKDYESQTLEDVICLVFLEHYFEDFAARHQDDKVIDIVQKTWIKMSPKGHRAALNLPLSDRSKDLVGKALV